MLDVSLGVLVAAYIFLVIRWELVVRPALYKIGFIAILVALLGGIFPLVALILTTFGCIVAFAAAVGACYKGELPANIPGASNPPK